MFCGGDSFTGDHSGGGKQVGGNGLSTCFWMGLRWVLGGFTARLHHFDGRIALRAFFTGSGGEELGNSGASTIAVLEPGNRLRTIEWNLP